MQGQGQYIGLELGADISADLNLDDFLVFDNDQEKAVEFFKNLIFKHYQGEVVDSASSEIQSPDQLIRAAFTQYPVFVEFVRAVEGVPRDALNLIGKAVTKSLASGSRWPISGQLPEIGTIGQSQLDTGKPST